MCVRWCVVLVVDVCTCVHHCFYVACGLLCYTCARLIHCFFFRNSRWFQQNMMWSAPGVWNKSFFFPSPLLSALLFVTVRTRFDLSGWGDCAFLWCSDISADRKFLCEACDYLFWAYLIDHCNGCLGWYIFLILWVLWWQLCIDWDNMPLIFFIFQNYGWFWKLMTLNDHLTTCCETINLIAKCLSDILWISRSCNYLVAPFAHAT